MIRNREVWTNPYRNHTRHNGVHADRFVWIRSDAERTHANNVFFAIAFAAVLGFACGVIVMLLATGV